MQADGTPHIKSRNWSYSFKYFRMAASWLIFFTLGLSAMYLMKIKPVTLSSRPVIVSVPLGAKSHIVLPDGTKIWINAGTQITYNQNYGIETRTLDLSGEAYFDVARDPNHPFIVNVSGLKIRALGTKFNVKAYPEEKSILATLEEGKIDVEVLKSRRPIKNIVLLPNENIVFQKSGQTIIKGHSKEPVMNASDVSRESLTKPARDNEIRVIKNVNTKLYTSWKEERWIIEGEKLGTLAPMLERRYNIRILFKDEDLKKYNFTATIQNETIEQILNAIGLTAPVDFIMNKDTVILTTDSAMKDQIKQITKPVEK